MMYVAVSLSFENDHGQGGAGAYPPGWNQNEITNTELV